MSKKSKPPFGAKAAFVRANPSLSAQDIVLAAKKQGLPLTVGHVYNIRAEERRRRDAGALPPPNPATSAGAGANGVGIENQLRALVLRMGLDRAEHVFAGLKASLTRLP